MRRFCFCGVRRVCYEAKQSHKEYISTKKQTSKIKEFLSGKWRTEKMAARKHTTQFSLRWPFRGKWDGACSRSSPFRGKEEIIVVEKSLVCQGAKPCDKLGNSVT
jgi:hypothetical protein